MLGAVIAFNERLQTGLSRVELRSLDQVLAKLADNVRAASGTRSG